nr:unnamed protein product [Callosobruchus chinensis]
MVINAIKGLKERGGSSLQAIKKYIAANYKVDAEKVAPFIKRYLKSSVASGALVQTKGKGASGSFKLASSSAEKTTGAIAKKAGGAKSGKKAASSPKVKKPSAAGAAEKKASATKTKKSAKTSTSAKAASVTSAAAASPKNLLLRRKNPAKELRLRSRRHRNRKLPKQQLRHRRKGRPLLLKRRNKMYDADIVVDRRRRRR